MNTRRFLLRTPFKLSSIALALGTLSACAPSIPPTTSLRVKGNVRDASVTVDDQYIGALAFVASRGVALPPGKHRITVEKTGYFPWDREIIASEKPSGEDGKPKPISLVVELVKIPD